MLGRGSHTLRLGVCWDIRAHLELLLVVYDNGLCSCCRKQQRWPLEIVGLYEEERILRHTHTDTVNGAVLGCRWPLFVLNIHNNKNESYVLVNL